MRFFDSLKMALHNLCHNKSRALLTVVIVLIVGALLMALNIFAIAFYSNMDMVFRKAFAEQGTVYYFNSYYSNSSASVDYYNDKEIEVFMEALDEYSDVVDSVTFGANFNWAFTDAAGAYSSELYYAAALTSFRIPADAEDGCLIEGRLWGAEDKNTAGVWVTDTFTENYYKAFGTALRAGAQIGVTAGTYESVRYETFTVKGILDGAKIASRSSMGSMNSGTGIYFDFEYIMGVTSFQLYSVNMSFQPKSEDYDFGYTYGRITSFLDAVNKDPDMRQNENSGFLSFLFSNDRLTAEVVNNISMARMMGIIVIVLILFISFVILLLSVGSIANSIIISTDKNKKFIGLMKALGLQNKGVNRIINLEASLQILLGVLISFVALLIFRPALLSVMDLAFGSIFKSISGGIEYTLILNIPFYIPIAVFAAFLGMALLSARGSLVRLGKMDVIAIMSEVA